MEGVCIHHHANSNTFLWMVWVLWDEKQWRMSKHNEHGYQSVHYLGRWQKHELAWVKHVDTCSLLAGVANALHTSMGPKRWSCGGGNIYNWIFLKTITNLTKTKLDQELQFWKNLKKFPLDHFVRTNSAHRLGHEKLIFLCANTISTTVWLATVMAMTAIFPSVENCIERKNKNWPLWTKLSWNLLFPPI